jgi:hypothetical protein
MGQIKGQTGKPNGRPKGSSNKVTADLRKWITLLLEYNKEQFIRDLQAVSPEQRLSIYVKLVSYAVPRMEWADYGPVEYDMTEIPDINVKPDAD